MSATPDPDLERVQKAAQALGEHFDTVQIFVTRHESFSSDGTHHIARGLGNWFGRYGQVRDWILRVEAENCRPELKDEEGGDVK